MTVCLLLGLIVRLAAPHSGCGIESGSESDWLNPTRRGPEQAQAAENGLCQVPARPPAERRRAERHGGNAAEGESEVANWVPLGADVDLLLASHFVCDFVISGFETIFIAYF